MSFGRKDMSCPRCVELSKGAPARKGWVSRQVMDMQRVREIRAHDCAVRGCGPVCTFGDW